MEGLDDIYNDLIMEHSMNSYNKKNLDSYDYCELGHNPNCGDEMHLKMYQICQPELSVYF